jgi:hypothetical protein
MGGSRDEEPDPGNAGPGSQSSHNFPPQSNIPLQQAQVPALLTQLPQESC